MSCIKGKRRVDFIVVEEHQRFQVRIEEIQKDIEKKDKIIQDIAAQLKKAESLLEEVIDDAKAKISVIKF